MGFSYVFLLDVSTADSLPLLKCPVVNDCIIAGTMNHIAVVSIGANASSACSPSTAAMYNLPEIAESADHLERLVRTERDAQIQRRFHMLLLKSGEAKSRSAAARHLGVHRNTVADLAYPLRGGRPGGASARWRAGPGAGPAVDSAGSDAGARRVSGRAGGLCQLQGDSEVVGRGAQRGVVLLDCARHRAIRDGGEAEGPAPVASKKSPRSK